jgi:hypothetical protein
VRAAVAVAAGAFLVVARGVVVAAAIVRAHMIVIPLPLNRCWMTLLRRHGVGLGRGGAGLPATSVISPTPAVVRVTVLVRVAARGG